MAQWIMKANGNVVPRHQLRPLQIAEIHSDTEKAKRQVYDDLIKKRWGTSVNLPPSLGEKDKSDYFEENSDEVESPRSLPEQEEAMDLNGKSINQQLQLQLENNIVADKVIKRALGPDGRAVGSYNDDDKLNSLIYELEFPDGQVKEYAANVIAENMLSQVDEDGFSSTLMDGIIDYKKDASAFDKTDRYIKTSGRQQRLRQTTVGWKLLIKWKDGTKSWIPLNI